MQTFHLQSKTTVSGGLQAVLINSLSFTEQYSFFQLKNWGAGGMKHTPSPHHNFLVDNYIPP